jgi:hypothetical protein
MTYMVQKKSAAGGSNIYPLTGITKCHFSTFCTTFAPGLRKYTCIRTKEFFTLHDNIMHPVRKIYQWLLGIGFILCLHSATAQQGWELGGWLGGAHYFGDLNTRFQLKKPGYAGGIVGRYNFNERICFKMSGNYGLVSADDALSDNPYEFQRNLSFKSNIFDFTGDLEFNFLPYIHGSRDQFYTPYLFAGFSVFNFDPKALYNDEWIPLRPLGTEGQFRGEEYYGTVGALAFGGGMKIDLSYRWSLNFEITVRKTFTDYLDDVSTVYPDMSDLESLRGATAVALSDRGAPIDGVPFGLPGLQRGNSQDKDYYVMAGISLVYYFGDIRCPWE